MKRNKVVFIILHYMAIEDTHECIQSIKSNMNIDEYNIIVIDNKSPDDSGNELLNRYKFDESVVVLLNDKNYGFAKGNNIGIKYALDNYDFEFCVVLNNDTLLLESGLHEVLEKEYHSTNFAVLGPMIYTADGRCDSNPARSTLIDADYINKELVSEKRHLMAEENTVIRWIRNIWFRIKPLYVKPKEFKHKNFIKKQINVQLHGSFLVFSKKYFEKFDGFYNETFLYHEEEILHLLVSRTGMTTVYQPLIRIYHKEDASTNAINASKHSKRLFVLENSVASLEILKRIYERNI